VGKGKITVIKIVSNATIKGDVERLLEAAGELDGGAVISPFRTLNLMPFSPYLLGMFGPKS